ncbi:SGNH hydrolase-type esterase domain-containing protein, partial [Massariosphaeria phaeospora]
SSPALSAPNAVKRAQTVYLAGDSTMAQAKDNTQGWGVYLPYSLTLPVTNLALGGRSTRSYTREGRFATLLSRVQPSDIVIIEFGHNDGGSLSKDNGRSVCPGAGSETCKTTYNNAPETVLTYPAYLIAAGSALAAKGARVIISSPTPNNPWEGGVFSYAPGRFRDYARSAAKAIGSAAVFVDHGLYTANAFQALGKAKVDKLFPNDHTHTSAEGADVVHRAFVKALLCAGGGGLEGGVRNATEGVEGKCV